LPLVPRRKLLDLLRRNPEVGYHIVRILSEEILQMRKAAARCSAGRPVRQRRRSNSQPQRVTIRAYNGRVQHTPSFMLREPTFLRIEVISNDADETFETSVHCCKNDCRRMVDIDSDGPKTVQSVSCPKHGFLISFPHLNALGEFVRFSANKILAANGRELIETEALFIFGNIEPHNRSVN